MGKGEIARYEQFLLFPQCFQKTCFPGASRGVIVWEWVKEEGSAGYEDLHFQRYFQLWSRTVFVVWSFFLLRQVYIRVVWYRVKTIC